MSVINNVLKDLENKPSAFTPLELADVSGTVKKQKSIVAVLSLILLFVVILSSFYFYFKLPEEVPATLKLLAQPVDATPDKEMLDTTVGQNTSPVTPVSKEIDKTEITGLQINETKDFFELTLRLPLGAQSFLKQSSLNRYVFLISNASSKIIIPQIKDNDWLKSISVEKTKEGLEIQFLTMDKVMVETHHTEKENNYFWNIRLKKSVLSETPERNDSTIALTTQSTLEPLQQQLAHDEVPEIDKDNKSSQAVTDSDIQQNVKLEIKPVISRQSDEALFNTAQTAYRQKDWFNAQRQLNALLGSRLDKKVRLMLLTVYRQQANKSEMEALLSKSQTLYPEDTDFSIIDAELLFSEKQYFTLLKRYRNQLQNKNIINYVAAAFQRTEQHENAIEYYQKSLKLDTQQPRKWISLAISQEHLSQFDRARESYKIALNSGRLNNRLQTFIQQRLQQLSVSKN